MTVVQVRALTKDAACVEPPLPPPWVVMIRLRVAAVLATVVIGGLAPASSAPSPDALSRRTMSELAAFTNWLDEHDVKGYVGEVGWPADDPRWTKVAERWFAAADEADLWVTAWLTTEYWGLLHPLSVYASREDKRPVSVARSQAAVVEAHQATSTRVRGVNFSGGEAGFPHVEDRAPLSNVDAGNYGEHYRYGTQETYAFLAGQGVTTIRLPFRWERLQPRLLEPLDVTALDELRSAVNRIERAGMRAIIDLHNFGGYYVHDPSTGGGRRLVLGSSDLPSAALADFWARMAVAFRSESGVVAYDLMNEPSALGPSGAAVWERASSEAVAAIRRARDNRTVVVEGYDWSALHNWARAHPEPWIDDPVDNVRYGAHHYWDARHSSQYRTYDEELRDAEAEERRNRDRG